jgi:hypothetical protein
VKSIRSFPPASRIWYGLMALAGFAFGLIGDRRPFGTDVLAHPFVVFFIGVGAALLVLRIAQTRPVPEVIPQRALIVGCFIGGVAFLIGNWIAAHLAPG